MEYNGQTRFLGSVTIYLSLTLLIIMALICTLIESGRVNVSKAKLKGITYMAVNSCFAEYAREMFDEYGIMGLWMDEAEFIGEYNDYVNKNINFRDTGLYQSADLYLLEHDGSAILNVNRITDNNGQYFEKQVNEYMDYFLIKEGLEKVIEYFDVFKEGSKVSAFVNKISEYQDVFLKVGNAVADIQQSVDKAKSVINNPKATLGNMVSSIENFEKTNNRLYATQFDVNYWALINGRSELRKYMDDIQNETDNFHVYSEQAELAIGMLKQELELDADDYSEETLNAIRQQVNTLDQKSGNASAEYYKVDQNCEAAVNIKNSLDNLRNLVMDIGEGVDHTNILDFKDEINSYYSSYSGFSLDGLGLDNGETRVKRENSGFISTIGDIFSKGLITAVTTGKISDKHLDKSDLPSAKAKHRSIPGSSKLLMGEYILKHFGCYTEVKDKTALEYEVEYILGGKSNDKDNLKKVIKDVVLLRAGLNMISFMQDPVKMEQAAALALAIIGFTGMDLLVESLKMIIISTWCLAESLCDVKTLLAGGKVQIVKASEEWTISAIGLKNFSKTIIPAATSDNGIGYSEYLRVLLLMQNQTEQEYRAMDLIQANMRKNYNKNFRMQDCICSINLMVQYESRQLFTAFPFVRNLIGNGRGKYEYQYVLEYAY